MATELVEMEGHLIDSLLLPKVLDIILSAGADYRTVEFDMGKSNVDMSRVRMEVRASSDEALEGIIGDLQVHGVNRVDLGHAETTACQQDGVLPAGFYATTNLPTFVRVSDAWIEVETQEVDCAIVVNGTTARTMPMHKVKVGESVVVGQRGVRVSLPEKSQGETGFEFLNAETSTDRPKRMLVADVAKRMRLVKEGNHASGNRKVLVVAGPAVVHTGAAPALAQLVKEGWVDVLFAGNGFASHDLEAAVMGTSLGLSLTEGDNSEGGHLNHLRVINEVRRYGSIAAAVDSGYVESGVMFECIKKKVPFVLAGSVRDDGPLPDVLVNTLDAVDAMRYLVPDVGLVLMLSTTLHASATANLLPANVDTFCVDINPAVATKLGERSSHQTAAITTDVGLFVEALAQQLVG